MSILHWKSCYERLTLRARDRLTLEELRQELRYTIDTLNEEELKVYFIGPLLRLIPFRSDGRRSFLDRLQEISQRTAAVAV